MWLPLRPFTDVGGKQVLPEGGLGGGEAGTVTAIHAEAIDVGIQSVLTAD